MKKLLHAAVPTLLVLFAACATRSTTTRSDAPSLLKSGCLISGEAVDADSPSADFAGGKVGFCCKSCLGKWNALDAAGKQARFDAAK
jgi:hypothetical protein